MKNYLNNFLPWFLSKGLKITLILLSAYCLLKILNFFINRVIKRHLNGKKNLLKTKRAETLISIFVGTAKFIIWVAALIMVLSELGVNIAPVLAGVGVVGLAVGMAAREIVADFLSGIFIILEDQYRVGDKIKIAAFEGVVEEITLRRTKIKDSNGDLHSIPNSQVKIISQKPEDNKRQEELASSKI